MIFSKINLIVGAVIGALAVFGIFSAVNAVYLLPQAREHGKQAYIAEKAVEDLKNEQERRKDDAQLQGMSDYDLCVRAIGRVPGCDVFLQPVR